MTNDERTLILLAAEALRYTSHFTTKVRDDLAEALDRIAGKGEEPRLAVKEGDIFAVIEPRDTTTLDPRFGPNTTVSSATPPYSETARFTLNSGKCWRCRRETHNTKLCSECAGEHVVWNGGSWNSESAIAWIEAEERGKP